MDTLAQKLRAGEQFLARGRFHEIADAANMAVDAVSFRPLHSGLIFFRCESIIQLDKLEFDKYDSILKGERQDEEMFSITLNTRRYDNPCSL